jgi:hypothetical protein
MSIFYFYHNKVKSTIIANELQLLEFGKVVVVIDIVIITLVAPTPNVLEGLNSQGKVYFYANKHLAKCKMTVMTLLMTMTVIHVPI